MRDVCRTLVEYTRAGCKVCDHVKRFSNQHKQLGSILKGEPNTSVLYCDTLHTGKIEDLFGGKVSTPVLTMTLVQYDSEGQSSFKWYGARVLEQGNTAQAAKQAIIDFCDHGTGTVRRPTILWTDPGTEFQGAVLNLLEGAPGFIRKVTTPVGASSSNGVAEALNKRIVNAIRVLSAELGIRPYEALGHLGVIMERLNEAERVRRSSTEHSNGSRIETEIELPQNRYRLLRALQRVLTPEESAFRGQSRYHVGQPVMWTPPMERFDKQPTAGAKFASVSISAFVTGVLGANTYTILLRESKMKRHISATQIVRGTDLRPAALETTANDKVNVGVTSRQCRASL